MIILDVQMPGTSSIKSWLNVLNISSEQKIFYFQKIAFKKLISKQFENKIYHSVEVHFLASPQNIWHLHHKTSNCWAFMFYECKPGPIVIDSIYTFIFYVESHCIVLKSSQSEWMIRARTCSIIRYIRLCLINSEHW